MVHFLSFCCVISLEYIIRRANQTLFWLVLVIFINFGSFVGLYESNAHVKDLHYKYLVQSGLFWFFRSSILVKFGYFVVIVVCIRTLGDTEHNVFTRMFVV